MNKEIIAATLNRMEMPEMPTNEAEWDQYEDRRGRQICNIAEDILNEAFPTLKAYTVFQKTQVMIILMGVPTRINVIDLMTMYPEDLINVVFRAVAKVKMSSIYGTIVNK